MTSKNTNRAIRDTNADKTTVLLSHLRNNQGCGVGVEESEGFQPEESES